MRVGPTLATGKHGWEMLIGRMAAGFPSQSPGKQDEKVAKPPVEKTGTLSLEQQGQDHQYLAPRGPGWGQSGDNPAALEPPGATSHQAPLTSAHTL